MLDRITVRGTIYARSTTRRISFISFATAETALKQKKDRLIELHRKDKAKNDSTRCSFDNSSPDLKSVVFNAILRGISRTSICADNCADRNIIDSSTLKKLIQAGVENKIESPLTSPRISNNYKTSGYNLPDDRV